MVTMNKKMRRTLNSLGYGVQSPNDFYFVQSVLRERTPYYAYATLAEVAENAGKGLPHYAGAVERMLFRLANYVHPSTIVEVGAGTSALALAEACPTAQCVTITSDHERGEMLARLLTAYPHAEVKSGDEMAIFEQQLAKWGGVGMVHIAHTTHYREAVEEALDYADDNMIIIIEELRASKEKLAWWNQLRDGAMTGTCYDLGNVGIIFLDRSRYKQVYWIKLRK
jgi:predicted O-methyltransferase YrrM